jgi:hypothetical protein
VIGSANRPGCIALALGLALAACGPRSPEQPAPSAGLESNGPFATTSGFAPPPAPPLSARMECVPYARAVTGIAIRGDAWSWWEQAAGRYERGRVPAPYAVLVLDRGVRLGLGHLAVVRRVLDRRRIRVDHANWRNDGRIVTDMTAIDVSAANDWTEVRFWNGGAEEWGNVYVAKGFIYPPGVDPPDATAALTP